MKALKLALLALTFSILGSCAPVDPSVHELKSPCVANEFSDGSYNGLAPCVKRSPLENYVV